MGFNGEFQGEPCGEPLRGKAREGVVTGVSTLMTPCYAAFLQGTSSGMASLLMMVAIFAIFYFLLIMPQQRRQKKWQQMLSELKSGDHVTTSGGIQGIILSIKTPEAGDPGTVILRVPPDNLRIEVSRSAIVTVRTDDGSKS